MSTISELTNPYHAYIFGTSFWYFLRGIMRVIDPETVVSWFRPPAQRAAITNDLEIYTVFTDGFGLLTLSMLLLALADAVPLPGQMRAPAISTSTASAEAKRPFARAAIVITIFHHVTTGYGAYQHWARETHRTTAMDIGVYGNIFLTILGVVALQTTLSDKPLADKAVAVSKKRK